MQPAGKTALITGAARKNGRAFAGACLRDGVHRNGVDAVFAKCENKAPKQKKREVGVAVSFKRMGIADKLTGMAVFPARDAAKNTVAQPTTWMVDNG